VREILEKPLDREEAFKMIRRLSGRSHIVSTGVTLRSKEKETTFSAETTVWFKEIDDDEINYYLDNYSPYDKAGSYGAQDWLGYTAIKRIEGSYFNVVGLPVQKLSDKLKEFIIALKQA
jgi:septum formation protein